MRGREGVIERGLNIFVDRTACGVMFFGHGRKWWLMRVNIGIDSCGKMANGLVGWGLDYLDIYAEKVKSQAQEPNTYPEGASQH